MAHKVTLQPGGKTFTVEAGERVLEAALRQGIHLPYGCRTGSCGTCRAHVVAGDTHYPDGPPLALTALEIRSGEALLCRAVPRTDLVLDAQPIDAMAHLRVRALPCRVARLEPLAHDVMGLYLRLPAVERLQFLPGQYIDILMPENHRRSFSLANPPHDDTLLELHVRNVPGGRFSKEVFQHLHEGALLRIQGPLGTFFLREDSSRPLVMIAGGTGYAPIQAMLRHVFEHGHRREIAFYWGARAVRDLYADTKLKEWTRSQPGFRYVPVLSEPLPHDQWTGRRGFVHQAVLEDFPDLSGHDIYLSGPPPMVQAARAAFPGQGADPLRMYSDSFDFPAEVRAALEAVQAMKSD
ncbi:MAG TPA: CDP-6-deoxy-delta-3,4-glucoseen reductase [Gammaproteobacteria bacterium]|nr:CDP-6-deoxy-delta-3,4-glucoseen reductase [Gammaproteobacteria bacterium]